MDFFQVQPTSSLDCCVGQTVRDQVSLPRICKPILVCGDRRPCSAGPLAQIRFQFLMRARDRRLSPA